ncbi:ATP-binding cassette domain-containing protein, partial [Pseudoalteromonas carrageenovora]|uniref:ATP-binding cassette domain-containing protein n=1 Tax=Pseudoalteromonas carrageenovora TaxID=227 RepID=UPI00311E2711
TISINNLNFRYPYSNEGIKNINLDLPNKGLVAVVGASGSGKSTLFDCLLWFQPQVIGLISIYEKTLDAT